MGWAQRSLPAPLRVTRNASEYRKLFRLHKLDFYIDIRVQETQQTRIRELLAKETKLELDRKRNGIIELEDLITPSKKLWALGTLYSSLVSQLSLVLSRAYFANPSRWILQDWFINRISALNTAGVSSDQSASSLPVGFGGSAFAGRGRGVRESGYSSSDGSPASGNRAREGTEEDGGDDEREPIPRGLPLTGDMAR